MARPRAWGDRHTPRVDDAGDERPPDARPPLPRVGVERVRTRAALGAQRPRARRCAARLPQGRLRRRSLEDRRRHGRGDHFGRGLVIQQSLADDAASPAAPPVAERVSPAAPTVPSRPSPGLTTAAASRHVSSREHGRGNGARKAASLTSLLPSLATTTTTRAGARPTATAPVAKPTETGDPVATDAGPPTAPDRKDTVVLPETTPLPEALRPLPDLGLDDPLVPPVEVPSL